MKRRKKYSKTLLFSAVSIAAALPVSGFITPTRATVQLVRPIVEFTSPMDGVITTEREADVKFNFKLNNPDLVNKDIKVSLRIAQHDEYFNDSSAIKSDLMIFGEYRKVNLPTATQEVELTFENVYLPFLGQNSIFCVYDDPTDTTTDLLECLKEDDSAVKNADLSVKYSTSVFMPEDMAPLYRFWSEEKMSHFYTINEYEKYNVRNNDPSWEYEGIAYYVGRFIASDECDDLNKSKVYRFWNEGTKHHFYTINQEEKLNVINNDPNWAYEGSAFCADVDQNQSAESMAENMPVYRFYSQEKGGHFYTISETERDIVITTDPSWEYEGIAYYAMK